MMRAGFTPGVSRWTLLVFCLVALLIVAWTPLPQEGRVVVRGRVVNGTPGGGSPEGLEVTLRIFDAGAVAETLTAPVAADGSFLFDGLSAGEGATFLAEVTYRGVGYFSESVVLEAGQQELELPVTVYEVTEDPATVRVTQLHIFMSRVGDRLQVGEYYLIGNGGDRTYIGSESPEAGARVTLRFTLPAEAEGLSFDGPGLGERFVGLEEGFADTRPVPPGQVSLEVFFRYELPYREGLEVRRAFPVPVASVVVIMPQGELTLEGTKLTSAGTVDTQMGPSFSYTAGPLAAGEELVFTLVPAPPSSAVEPTASAPTGGLPTRDVARENAIGAVALAVAAVGAYMLLRPGSPGPIPPRIRPLVERIAALDERFEAGEIGEEAYRMEREKLKRQARNLLEHGKR